MAESPVAILTGGAQGVGAAICVTLLKKGYKVYVSDVQEEKGKQFVKEQQEKFGSDNVKFIVCDVTKEEDYKRLFDITLKEFKRIDLVLNNAGIVCEKNPRKTVDVNLMGVIFGCQLSLQYLGKSNGGKGGMVINTSSISGFLPLDVVPAYTASKHGVIGLTRCYGSPFHLERDGVLFMAICPSVTDTPLLLGMSTLKKDYDAYEVYDGVIMTPEYVAQGVLKLLEDKINGSTLVVNKKDGYTYIGLQEEFKTLTF